MFTFLARSVQPVIALSGSCLRAWVTIGLALLGQDVFAQCDSRDASYVKFSAFDGKPEELAALARELPLCILIVNKSETFARIEILEGSDFYYVEKNVPRDHPIEWVFWPGEQPLAATFRSAGRGALSLQNDACAQRLSLAVRPAKFVKVNVDKSSVAPDEFQKFEFRSLDMVATWRDDPIRCPDPRDRHAIIDAIFKMPAQDDESRPSYLDVYYDNNHVFRVPADEIRTKNQIRLVDFQYEVKRKSTEAKPSNNLVTGLVKAKRKTEILLNLPDALLVVEHLNGDEEWGN